MRRHQFAEFSAGGPVSLPDVLDCARAHVACDHSKDDGVPSQRVSYRSNGPLLSGRAEISAKSYGAQFDGPALWVDIRNRGRGPVTVDSALIWAGGYFTHRGFT
jgi:hypothetical protein